MSWAISTTFIKRFNPFVLFNLIPLHSSFFFMLMLPKNVSGLGSSGPETNPVFQGFFKTTSLFLKYWLSLQYICNAGEEVRIQRQTVKGRQSLWKIMWALQLNKPCLEGKGVISEEGAMCQQRQLASQITSPFKNPYIYERKMQWYAYIICCVHSICDVQ